MSFDRSKYKTSKSLQQQQKELEASGKIKSGSNGTPNYIEIKEDGDYYLRFWPSHLKEDGTPISYFMLPRKQHFLEFMKDKYEDGKLVTRADGTPEQILGKGTIFNAVTHGSSTKDIIEEYINFVRKQGIEMYPEDKEGYKKYMKYIYGYGSGKNYVGGITANEEYIAYASLINKDTMKEEQFGRIVLKSSMRKGMLTISATDGEDNEGIVVDPFTDPDDGFIVKITKDSAAAKAANDPSLFYSVSFYSKNYVPVKWPLPDGFEQRYEEIPSLSSLLENLYNYKDFQKALDGLARFDEKNNYNVFSQDSWLDICEELSKLYPEDTTINTEVESNEGDFDSDEYNETTSSVEAKEEPSPWKEEKSATNISAQDKLAAMKAKISGGK